MEKILECTGGVDDLMTVSPDGSMKCANIIYLGDNPMDADSEVFHISITSSCMNGKHDVFDKMLGKNIKVTVEIDE